MSGREDQQARQADGAELQALRRQDAGAFGRLVDRHQALVMGLCQSLGLRGADSDDAAAEAFAAVYRALPGFDGRSELATWIYRIAWRTIVKVRQRLRRSGSAELPEDRADESQPTPESSAERKETNERLWQAVAALDERQAAAVEMHYRRGWAIEQIAEVLECPSGTVKTLLFRARERLRVVLAREEIVP